MSGAEKLGGPLGRRKVRNMGFAWGMMGRSERERERKAAWCVEGRERKIATAQTSKLRELGEVDGPTSTAQDLQERDCPGKRSHREGLLMSSICIWRMDDREDGHGGEERVGEVVGDCGVLFGGEKLVGSRAPRFQGHPAMKSFVL